MFCSVGAAECRQLDTVADSDDVDVFPDCGAIPGGGVSGRLLCALAFLRLRQVLGCVDVEKFPRREAHAARGGYAGELVQGKAARIDLVFDDGQHRNGEDDGEGGLTPGERKDGALAIEYGQAAAQGRGGDKWHVAGKEQDGEGAGGF